MQIIPELMSVEPRANERREPSKTPLTHEELRSVIDGVLWAGQLLLQHGAASAKVEETIHRLGTGLGCDWLDILVSPNAIIITASSGVEFRTKVRRVINLGVNMTILAEVNDLNHRVEAGEISRAELHDELRRISHHLPRYNRWVVVVAVGLACAAFSRLFGADWPAFFVTFVASAVGMAVRQQMHHHSFNMLLSIVVTAFVTGLIASIGALLKLGATPQLALASAVLLLVPGVPLINSADDLMKGHLVTGIVRGATGALIAMCIALGLLLAMALTGVHGL